MKNSTPEVAVVEDGNDRYSIVVDDTSVIVWCTAGPQKGTELTLPLAAADRLAETLRRLIAEKAGGM